MRAVRRFTVRTVLPPALAPLGDLVTNLRWSWHPPTRDLFEAVAPEVWATCEGDPVRLLGEVSGERLSLLAGDPAFLARLRAAAADLTDYLGADRWYQTVGADVPAAIGYFSMEYGLTEVLPQYSGGLGILAGDHLKAASDLGVPIVGVGLLYKSGYFVQSLSADGWQQERYPGLDPNGLPITRLLRRDGAPLQVGVDLPHGHVLHADVWVAQVGRVPLLLLHSDVEGNEPELRQVTDRLYGGGSDHRLRQEMLLGIGGVRALRAYAGLSGTPQPDVFHCNEGHAGFLGVERLRELVVPAPGGPGLSVDEALQVVRAGTVFTTHTPVPAGIDRFPRELIAAHFADVPGVPVERILALGAEPDPDVFNMAHMGLRLAARCNGVSRLHGAVSREMFAGLWPGFDHDEIPIGSVTNGVHAPTWVAREVMEIAARDASPAITTEAAGWEAIDRVADEVIWSTRRLLRSRLVHEVRRRVRASWLERGAAEAELGWVEDVFDPDVLTIGFARRVPSYKRLTLMLRDPARLTALLLDRERPLQIVVAGKSHPADDGGKALVQQMVQFADRHDLRHRIVFLPDYDMGMARFLYSGSDIWLNNPLRPLEACGTSGMKAALNGCLNLSIRDGWWDEMYDGENGWAIPTAGGGGAGGVSDERRDDLEAAALYDLFEGQVRGRFYDRRDESGVPARWVAMVRHDLKSLGPQVLASRMLRDYVTGLYGPAAVAVRSVGAPSFAGARELAGWIRGVRAAWPGVRVAHVESGGIGDAPERGQQVELRAVVDLGGLAADAVDVQAVFGPVDAGDEIRAEGRLSLSPAGDAGDGSVRYEGSIPLDRAGSFGYAVRVLPRHPLLASEADLGLMAT